MLKELDEESPLAERSTNIDNSLLELEISQARSEIELLVKMCWSFMVLASQD